jgi:hypothetical protein
MLRGKICTYSKDLEAGILKTLKMLHNGYQLFIFKRNIKRSLSPISNKAANIHLTYTSM